MKTIYKLDLKASSPDAEPLCFSLYLQEERTVHAIVGYFNKIKCDKVTLDSKVEEICVFSHQDTYGHLLLTAELMFKCNN